MHPSSLKIFFWNIHRKPLESVIGNAVREREADVVLLTECKDAAPIYKELNKNASRKYFHIQTLTERVLIFTSLPESSIQICGEYQGITFLRLAPPLGESILLVSGHLRSKLYMSDDDQKFAATRCAQKIKEFEARQGHQRTILVGDLNSNPFEPGIMAATGFHAASSRTIANKGSRVVQGERYDFFYNPMWNHFGDRGPSPPGTYYYERSSYTDYFWHMFDQVLIRPALLPYFNDEDLEIVTSVGGLKLSLPDSRPNAQIYSDHFPIFFRLNLLLEVTNG